MKVKELIALLQQVNQDVSVDIAVINDEFPENGNNLLVLTSKEVDEDTGLPIVSILASDTPWDDESEKIIQEGFDSTIIGMDK